MFSLSCDGSRCIDGCVFQQVISQAHLFWEALPQIKNMPKVLLKSALFVAAPGAQDLSGRHGCP